MAGIVAAGGLVVYLAESWLLGTLVGFGLTATLREFFVPVGYEVDSLGLRRKMLGRARVTPWHTIRSYRLRPTGVILFQRPDPIAIDLMRSVFVPYPADEDEALCALRQHLPHAVELPQ
jgi:hypothetical protein